MRRTKADADLTRQAILNAATQVFARDSYAAARLDDIAQGAGITRGAIAHHFGGKAEVFEALIAEKCAAIELTVESALAEGGTPAQRLRRFMIALLERLEDDSEYRAIQEITLFQRGADPALATGRQDFARRKQTYEDGIARLLEAGVKAGELRPGIDRTVVARAVLGLVSGVSLNWLLAPKAFSLKAVASAVVDSLLLGIVAQPPRVPIRGSNKKGQQQ